MRRLTTLLVTALLVTAACDSGEFEITAPEGEAVVEGRIESTLGGETEGSADEAASVAVMEVRADGSLDLLAEGTVDGSGYRIEGVPAGRPNLVVIALSAEDTDVGRVMVHGQAEADETVVVAPINGETTIEGLVFGLVRDRGFAEAATNTGGLAAFVRVGASEAEAIRTQSSQLRAMADAYGRSEAALTASFGVSDPEVELDEEARAELIRPLVLQYDEQRDGGASLEVAHQAFVDAVLSAYAQAGASDEGIALATATAATAAVTASTDFEDGTQALVARQALSVNLRARKRLAASASGPSTVNALAQARVNLSGATTMVAVRAALEEGAAAARVGLTNQVLDLVAGLSLSVRLQVEDEVDAAFAQADLAARLEGRSAPESLAGVLADYRTDVEAAVQEVAAEIPSEIQFDQETWVKLLIAAGASAWIE